MRKAVAFLVVLFLSSALFAERLGYGDPGDRDALQTMQHLMDNGQWKAFMELLPLVPERIGHGKLDSFHQERVVGMIRSLVFKGRYTEARALMDLARHLMPDAWWLWGVEDTWYRGTSLEPGPHSERFIAEMKGMAGDFRAGLVLLQILERSLYWAGVVVFWFFALYHFVRFVPLLSRDSLVGGEGQVLWGRLGAMLLLMFLPVLFGSGLFLLATPMVILGIVRVYLNEDERKAVRFQVVTALVVLLVLLFPGALIRRAVSPPFQNVLAIGEGKELPALSQLVGPDEKVLAALGVLRQKGLGCTAEMATYLVGTEDTELKALRLHLLGIESLQRKDASQAGKYLLDALAIDDRDPDLLSNFALAVLSGKEPNLDRVIQSYSVRFPGFPEAQAHLQGIRIPRLRPSWAWDLLIRGSVEGHPLWLAWGRRILLQVPHMPFALFFLLLPIVSLLAGKFLGVDGKGSFCPKCHRPVKRKPAQMLTRPLCEDCHQIFLIKDVVFLEAKMQKEKEYARQEHRRKLLMMGVSLFWPGFSGFLVDRHKTVVLAQTAFVAFLGIYGYGRSLMLQFRDVVPLIISLSGVAALVVYLMANILSVWGED